VSRSLFARIEREFTYLARRDPLAVEQETKEMSTSASNTPADRPRSPEPDRPPKRAARASSWAAYLLKGVVNLASVLLLVYLTYFFTMFFAAPRPGGLAPSAAEKGLAKKAQDLREQDRKIVSSYGWVNPAARSVRIPVERAMELIAAENAQPLPTAAPSAANVAATPGPGPVARAGGPQGVSVIPGAPAAAAPSTTTPAAAAPSTTTPAAAAPSTTVPVGAPPAAVARMVTPPAPARLGFPPEQVYVMVCATCHEADGRGTIARKTMKDAEQIPDLTDPKWQASRTDADLTQSILEGKGKIMLARKDILAAAHTDVKEMVALMRSFQGGKKVITGVPPGQPVALAPVPPAAATALVAPVFPPPALGTAAPQPSGPAVVPGAPTTAPLPLTGASPLPTQSTVPSAVGSGRVQGTSAGPIQATTSPGAPAAAMASTGAATAPAGSSETATGAGIALPAALPVSTVASPERAAKLRVAAEFYRTNCFACHAIDGKGTLVRPLMPAIPDFTDRQWQTSRSNGQLQTSILDGKGQFMPPWHGKLTSEFARDLISYVRTFGPPDLLAATAGAAVQNTEFENRLRELKGQRDEVERQLRELDRTSTIR
jgi:mono/diheme cytochrome c family protein